MRNWRLANYARQWVVPPNLPPPPDTTTVPEKRIGATGIELEPQRQLELLRRLGRHSHLFPAIREDAHINTWGPPELVANGMYHSPDAEIYSAMIAEYRPGRIVEIGSGFSTLIARRTVERLAISTRIEVCDPEPRTEVRAAVDRHYAVRVEDLEPDSLKLDGSSILFIDSSHICRAGGDLPFLFCQLIPGLPAGTLVHVHDIFIPFDYPVCYQRVLWNEQYLLHALLAHSQRYEVLLATHFLSRSYPDDMRAAFGPRIAEDPHSFGASFWFRVR